MMIPRIIFAYNILVHSSTIVLPFELLYGCKLQFVVAPIPTATQLQKPDNLERYLDGMLANRMTLRTHADENLGRDQRSQTEGHDKWIKNTRKFKVGDVAYLKEKQNEKKGKFRAKYIGPYTIWVHDEKTKIFASVPAWEGAEPIVFFISALNLQFCYLDNQSY